MQDHGLNRTRFLDQPQVYRVLHDEVDTRESDRWDTDRRINFEFIASDFYRTMVQNQARNVALNIQAAGDPQSQSCVKPTAAEMEQILTGDRPRRVGNWKRRGRHSRIPRTQ